GAAVPNASSARTFGASSISGGTPFRGSLTRRGASLHASWNQPRLAGWIANFSCAGHNSRYEFRVEDFTAGTISGQPARGQLTLGGDWDARVHKLVREFGAEQVPELIEEMIVTALRMAREKMSVADLKLISRSMKEMRYAAKIFANYQEFRKVGIFGSARIAQNSPEAKVAEEFCHQIVKENFM